MSLLVLCWLCTRSIKTSPKMSGFHVGFFLIWAYHLSCWVTTFVLWCSIKVLLQMLVIRAVTFLQSFIHIGNCCAFWKANLFILIDLQCLMACSFLPIGILSTICHFGFNLSWLDVFWFGFPNAVTVVWFYQMSPLSSYLMQITPLKHTYGSNEARLLWLFQIP